jgi:predicted permease
VFLANWFRDLIEDLRHGLRMLLKSPGFSAVAILTLALGSGANTAIFSVVDNVLFAPLPYFQPDRLVVIWESNPRFAHVYVSYPNFRDWQESARSFEQLMAFMEQGTDLSAPSAPEHLSGGRISSGFFRTLGVNLTLGREFSQEEDRTGAARVAILSNRIWHSRFGKDMQVLGKLVTLDGIDYTIVGVAPPKFRFETDIDIYTPLSQADPLELNNRGSHNGILVFARIRSGVTSFQAQEEMNAIQSGLDRLYPDANRDLGVHIVPLKQEVVGDVGGTLLLVLSAVGLVLLIGCANVASLLLARSAARTREFAIRSALGASRLRIARQLLTECLLLSFFGASLGLVVAVLGVRSVLTALPGVLPRTEDIGINESVLLFTLVVSTAVGILFGLALALKRWGTSMQSSLREGERGSTSSRSRIQSILVVSQISLTLLLLVAAGLLFRTMHRLLDIDPGFDSRHIVTFKVGVSSSLTKTAASTRTAYQQLIQRVRDIPGIQAADYSDAVPLTGHGGTAPFWIGSEKPQSLQAAPRLVMLITGPDYLKSMGIPLLRGRFFTTEDNTQSPCVVVIDSVLANKYFRDVDPLTQTVTAGFSPVGPCRIVGIVGHAKHWRLVEGSTYTQAQAYWPLYQVPDRWVPVNYPDAAIVAETSLDLATIMPALRSAVEATNADQPIYNIETMEQIVSDSMSTQRLPMVLLGAFAFLALLLASVGIYGVISYSVSLRIHEIGIRRALGAERKDVFRMIVGQGLRLALIGLVIGAIAAFALARTLTSFSQLLYGVSASDPLTFISVSLLLVSTTLLASYVPARRAMNVDPIVALRYE